MPSQKALAEHAASVVQVVGQVVVVPSQRLEPHAGSPGLPAFAGPQVPSPAEPRGLEQTSHDESQALSQQKPSVQCPEAQSLHPETKQSLPAELLHKAPWGFCSSQSCEALQ